MTINVKVAELRELKPRILVLGVGGAGGNAINAMIQSGLQGVEFVAVNTDAQDLKMNKADAKIQLGSNLTKGLGAGGKTDLGQAGVYVIATSLNDAGRIDLDLALAALARRGITRLLIEGGSSVGTALLSAGLIDRLAWFRAAGIMGNDGLPVFGDLQVEDLDKISRFRRIEVETLGDDILESYVYQA